MQYAHNVHLTDMQELPDDIDCLFELLPQVAPPSSLIKRILEQTPMIYAYDALPMSWHLQAPFVARQSFQGQEMHDLEHKKSSLC